MPRVVEAHVYCTHHLTAHTVACAATFDTCQALDKEPEKTGACVVQWPDDEDAGAEQQRQSLANFLGKGPKRQKVPDRHRLLHEASLEPVSAW